MSLSHQHQIPAMKFSREFDSWRGLEEDERYDCIIEAIEDRKIRIQLDIIKFSVSIETAVEIADCLRDAFSIALYGRANPWDDRDFSGRHLFEASSSGNTHYHAEGDIEVMDTSNHFFEDETSGSTEMVITTISGGGYEIVFDFMCYSFTVQDAIWMSNTLMAACGRPREQIN